MSAILPYLVLDRSALLSKYFLPYQANWIQAEDILHARRQQAFALAEKSVRIGWTFADAFKNVRKRLHYPRRDYLFATKDWPSALEYMNLALSFIKFFDFTRAVVSHGEDFLKVESSDRNGAGGSLTEEVKIGYIKFDNGSRIIAFSSNPYAMAVYGGDVGLDEFAKHPNAQLLWQTAQARVTWNYDLALWSSHDGEDTLFNQFAQQARAFSESLSQPLSKPLSESSSQPSSETSSQPSSSPPPAASSAINPRSQRSDAPNAPRPAAPRSPWNLYYRVTLPDALEQGLLDLINRRQGTNLTAEQFIANAKARAGSEEIFQQSYMCNPLGAASATIVEWSAIERCRTDYQIERLHLDADAVSRHFGEFNPATQAARQSQIEGFLRSSFPTLFSSTRSDAPRSPRSNAPRSSRSHAPRSHAPLRLGFDVAASGLGDLAAIYIDEVKGSELWLGALLTAGTEDWHFLKTALFLFLRELRSLRGAGDESGLGRQICWEAASQFGSRFLKVNFSSRKHDLGFALMNQLSVAEKRFPRSEQDIAHDYFALRKIHTGTRWNFIEGHNASNPVSHCDIAWAGALATHAHTENDCSAGAALLLEDGTIVTYGGPDAQRKSHEHRLLWSDDPAIWRPFGR